MILLYLWFLFRCIVLVKNCKKVFTALTVAGLGMLITVQATLHILVNVGYLPVTGHTLPLLSLGGTSLVILSCAFGIILSVSRTIDISSKNKALPATATAAPANDSPTAAKEDAEEERYEIMGPEDQFK